MDSNQSNPVNLNAIFSVDAKISPTTRLVDYLRNTAGLTGTKVQCREGGCGACTVLATVPDPENGGSSKSFSIQSVSGFIMCVSVE